MLTREEWYRLPMETKLRWYVETKFDRHPPSDGLLAEVRQALEKNGADRPGVPGALPVLAVSGREPADG